MELKLKVTADGGDIAIDDGEFVDEQSLETALFMTLFTDDGWSGNYFLSDDNRLGSAFRALLNAQKIKGYKENIEAYLATLYRWLDAYSSSWSVAISFPSSTRINLTFLIDDSVYPIEVAL